MQTLLIQTFFIFVLFFCPVFSTFSECENFESQDISTNEGLPSSLVNKSVCAISGEYTDHIVDVILPGPESLIVSRVYNSFATKKPWTFNHHEWLKIDEHSCYEGSPVNHISLRMPSGSILDYIADRSDKNKKIEVLKYRLIPPKGLTNGAVLLSGRTNIKNQSVRFKTEENLIEVVSGDGTKKTFKEVSGSEDGFQTFSQTLEKKPNGSQFHFNGKGKGISGVEKITCNNRENTIEFSHVNFTEQKYEDKISLNSMVTSDNRQFDYYFKEYKYHDIIKSKGSSNTTSVCSHYLTSVEHPYAPFEHYQYKERELSKELLLTSKSRNKGKNYVNIDYYRKKDNFLGGEIGVVHIEDKDDFRLDRVRQLSAPVGHNRDPIIIQTFDYHATFKKHKENGGIKVFNGYTNVYDAYQHKTRYTYDNKHRLTELAKYTDITQKIEKKNYLSLFKDLLFNDVNEEKKIYYPYSQECYTWGEKATEEGLLLEKAFKNAEGTDLYKKKFTYDDHGNVLSTTLYGNLTGMGDCNEQEIKTFTYSNDGLNLLLSQTDLNGVTITYQYWDKTDRLKAKLISDSKGIKLREFYFYDKNGALVKKMVDNGCSESYKDELGVTQCLYTYMKCRTEAPVGLPEVIEEKYLDNTKKEKVLLKKTECKYSPEGRLIEQKVYGSDGQFAFALSWEYDLHGNLTKETNALGVTIAREYDLATDNLITQTTTANGKICSTMTNSYDFANRLIEKKEVDEDENIFTTSYKYDYLGNKIEEINPFGQKTEQKFDEFSRVIEIIYPAVSDENNVLKNPTIKRAYDCLGFLVRLTDAEGRETHIENNIRGQPTKILYPDGTEESMLYALDGKLSKKIDKNGACTDYTRDYLGRVILETITAGNQVKQIKHTYDAFHLLKTEDPDGVITNYTYDEAGRLTSACRYQNSVEYHYDSLGRIGEVREYYGDKLEDYRSTIKRYDFVDRVIEEYLQSSDKKILHYSCYEYDHRGNRTLVRSGDQKTITKYNSLNEPCKITDSLGYTTHITYNTKFKNAFDQTVLQKITTDPLGYQIVETFDTANRFVEAVRLNPFGVKIGRQLLCYDLSGNQTSLQEEVIEKDKIVRTIQTLFEYNPIGEVIQITEAAGSPEQKITRTKYNAFGQKESFIKPDGTTIAYTYDPFGRLNTQISSDQTISYLYEYNLADQLIKVTDQLSKKSTALTYFEGNLNKEILANDLSLDYTYDKMGRISALTFPDGTGIEYCYNAVDLKEIHRNINGKREYSHHDQNHSLSGQIIKSHLPGNNGSVDYHYDTIGHCIKIDSLGFQQEVPPDGFDAVGNLIKFDAQKIAYQFTYDDHYQINSENGHAKHTYSYDSIANRISKDEEVMQHNALNQLIQKGMEKLVYDKNGNLIQKGIFKYSYDALNRLIKVTHNDKETHYIYDAFNRRIAKKQNGEEERFLYQGQDEIGKWKNGKCQELRLLGNNIISRTVALELAGIPYVPLHDMTGNIVSLQDLQGKQIEQYRYTAFGETEVLSSTGARLSRSSIRNPWQYAGKRLDEESGLIAFGMRYYDPALGRWITPDPAGFTDGPNLYAYVHNNSFKYFDRLGLFSEDYELSWDPIFPDYHISSFNDIHHEFAGTLHGGVDFFTHQAAGIGSMCCAIGSHEWDDPLDRLFSTNAFAETSSGYLNRFDNWFANSLGVDQSNASYQMNRAMTSLSLETGSLMLGGYGVAKAGYAFLQGAEFAGGLGLRGLKCSSREGVLATLDSRINQLSSVNQSLDLNALSRAGHIRELERNISMYLGENTKLIRNQAGDSILISNDGLRKVRFDFISPKPHNSPHMHVEFIRNNRWIDSGQIYPIDLPHN